MGIDEGECVVPGERNPLTGRIQRRPRCRRDVIKWSRHGDNGIEVEVAPRKLSEACKPRGEVGVFARLYEAKMTLREHQRFVTRDRP